MATGLAPAIAIKAVRGTESPSKRVVVGVMGTSRSSSGGDGRGAGLAVWLSSLPDVHVAYVCDVDSGRREAAAKSLGVDVVEG